MPKQRKKAPDATVTMAVPDERLNVEQEWDAKSPDYKHFWLSKESNIDAMKKNKAEPVKTATGELIENGISMLCRAPKEAWMARRLNADERSKRLYASIRNDDGTRYQAEPIVQFANPKSPPKPEGAESDE